MAGSHAKGSGLSFCQAREAERAVVIMPVTSIHITHHATKLLYWLRLLEAP